MTGKMTHKTSKRTALQGLQDIIDFAAAKEQESVEFYNNLLGMVKMQAVAAEIRKIVEMEERHRDVLKNIDVTAYARTLGDRDIDLRTADYANENDVKPTPDMSLDDLLKIAMQRERKAIEMYTDLSKLFAQDEKRLFQRLAAEESRHERLFDLNGPWGRARR